MDAMQQALDDDSIQAHFETFHEANPRVYDLLVRFARQAKARGQKVGIRMVWERMRWEIKIETVDSSVYKLNDHYTSRYARMIMYNEEDLRGFFTTRRLSAR